MQNHVRNLSFFLAIPTSKYKLLLHGSDILPYTSLSKHGLELRCCTQVPEACARLMVWLLKFVSRRDFELF